MIIRDFTDNDLYKFTTMNAIQKKFPLAEVIYQFINRGKTVFPEGFAEALREEVNAMKSLCLGKDAEAFIRKRCYYFDPVFIDLIKGFRFNPEEVRIHQIGGDLDIEIEGLWYRTVLWEVPLMAIISELYFKLTHQAADNYEPKAIEKAQKFAAIGANISEFGTRRRFSFEVQNRIVEIFKTHLKTGLQGTSNLYLAMKHDLTPMGTHPHEWFMYHGAHFGYRKANEMAMENWVDVYQGNLGIALTDTYTTDNFFDSFNTKYAKLYDGVRWDSGDPLLFTDKVLEHYSANRIDPQSKKVVYSDALDFEKVQEIKAHVNGRIRDSYGIGTYLTNDVGVKPLNMVIKLKAAKPNAGATYIPTVKLSDSEGKYTGNPGEIELCLKMIHP
ncbi:nicotinate phosphoribosyltransferase [Geofilum rubicundum]|uniref:Nicotinate phosphoribosyltransferase n=1 Tax=Geofilum rubicundum JCM 15548 TaxID=1236989 RepID=A0A0E9LUQ8_9BACT|nr:nicotinate phosphoribosyltransferase [Geofilum rubicundum]GAO28595.1 nicotinate phosphoribosyltransferase [Geofilum rubicundum JCM 15548]